MSNSSNDSWEEWDREESEAELENATAVASKSTKQ